MINDDAPAASTQSEYVFADLRYVGVRKNLLDFTLVLCYNKIWELSLKILRR